MEQQPIEPEAERDARREIHVTVNTKPVTLTRHRMSGLEIKQAAIDQGVKIQLDFVLSLELPNGNTRIIGDHQVVGVHDGEKFIAVASDDNS